MKKKNRNLKERWKYRFLPSPKAIKTIYINDMKEIFRNTAVLIIIMGLTVVPSLYAWFNIEAFWDPYGKTKFLQVAIVNQDEGAKFRDQHLDLGEKVIDKLKENDALDWQFVSKEEADTGLKTGKYFAIIRFPQDFSKDLISLTKEDVQQASIDYTVNEKINAVAPKITDKGASTIQQNINQALVETVSKVSIGSLGGLSNMIGDIDPKLEDMKESLRKLDKQLDNAMKLTRNTDDALDNMNDALKTTKELLPNIKTTVTDSKKLNGDIKTTLEDTNESINDISPEIKEDLELASSLLGQVSDMCHSLKEHGDVIDEDAKTLMSRIRSKTDNSIALVTGVMGVIERINTRDSAALNTANSSLKEFVDIMENLSNTVTDSMQISDSAHIMGEDTLNRMVDFTDSLNRRSVDILSHYDSKIKDPINKITKSSINVTDSLNKVLDDTNDKLYPNLMSLVDSTTSLTNTLNSTTSLSRDTISLLKSQVDDALQDITDIQDNEDYEDFNNVIKANILDRVDFLKDPVNINEKKIYQIENYGSAMAPFYSVLAAWVGGLVLVAVLSTSVPGKYRSVDQYFGRLLLFLTFSTLQTAIIALGDFFILGVTAKHAVLFSLILILCGWVFTVIIYSLVSMFSTIGKGMAVFLLVIQIGGSGGTFPVQMTPSFFRAINSIIPFTYGIDACREAVGGVYLPNLKGDLVALVIFFLIPVISAMLLKEPLNRMGHPMKKMFEDSFLIGH